MMKFDEQWVAALKILDSQAWDMLLRYHADELRRGIQASLAKRGMPASLVDDIEQETWLTAVRKITEFHWEDVDRFFRWLRVISLNHILTYRRKQGDQISMDDSTDSDVDDMLEQFYNLYSPANPSIEDEVARREQLSAVDRAMRELKPQEREMLLRWVMGEKPRDLARDYNMKAHSVSMVLLRAKEKIEANLLLGLLRHKDNGDV
jgi:RNA polymerase sigma factor (sigma-70 family)